MALPQTPISSSKQIENQKKPKKSKKNLTLQTPDSTHQQVAQLSPSSLPRKRTKSPGIRVVGGRIYDSENGKTCHQCRQKTMDFVAACKSSSRGKPCTYKFCHKCLLNRYGEKAEEVDTLGDWECPKCRGICNCSFCMKKKGHQPTGILVHTAKATGFQSVSEMLTVNGPNKENSIVRKDDSVLKSNTKAKGQKRKKSEQIDMDNNVGNGDEKKRKANSKLKKLVQAMGDVNVLEESKVNGVQLKNNSNEPSVEIFGNGKMNGTGDVVQKKHKKLKICKKKNSEPIKLEENGGIESTDGEKKIGEGDAVQKKHKKLKISKKNTSGSIKSEENGGIESTDGENKIVGNEKISEGDVVQKKHKKSKVRKNNSSELVKSKENGGTESTDGEKKKVKETSVVQKRKKSQILKESAVNPINTQDNVGTEDGKVKINGTSDVVVKKNRKSRKNKQNVLHSVKTEENGGIADPEDKSKSVTDCKQKTEPVISLPQGVNLTAVVDIQLPAEDVGPALQFLEFCRAFGEFLELKKGEPESVLRELTSGCSLRRRQYSSVVRFHVQLLSLIQKDMGEESPLSPTSNGSSWFQELGELISDCHCPLKEVPSECFDRSSDGYEKLDSSKRLRLLNFLCDEALSTKDLRGWIDKQNERLVKRGKEAKEKVLAAKEKERGLKQQMQDEVAKAILSKSGAPLSVSEHQDLVSRIKSEAAKAHEEKLEAIGMVPKKKQRSDAVRTEPVLLEENGRIIWRLRACSPESIILLQDIGEWGSDKPEDKWFTYDVEQKKAVENYISDQKKKRLRSQVLSDTCIMEGEKIVNDKVSNHLSSNQSN